LAFRLAGSKNRSLSVRQFILLEALNNGVNIGIFPYCLVPQAPFPAQNAEKQVLELFKLRKCNTDEVDLADG